MMHLNDPPPSLRKTAFECPIWLDQIIGRLMEKNPEERQYDARAVEHALAEVVEKVAEAESVAGQAALGETAVNVSQSDREELRQAMGKKKKKKKKKEPFFEQIWFLALCLCLLIAGITWAVWPMSEAKMFAQIEAGMKGDDLQVWRETRDEYLEPYLERFPEGEHAGEVKEYIARIDLRNYEIRLKKRGPDTAAEKAYEKAVETAEAGDLQAALAALSILQKDYADDSEAELLLKLAEEQSSEWEAKLEKEMFASIETAMGKDDPKLWPETRDTLLKPYLQRFPKGKHVMEIQNYLQKIELHELKSRLETKD